MSAAWGVARLPFKLQAQLLRLSGLGMWGRPFGGALASWRAVGATNGKASLSKARAPAWHPGGDHFSSKHLLRIPPTHTHLMGKKNKRVAGVKERGYTQPFSILAPWLVQKWISKGRRDPHSCSSGHGGWFG